MFGSKIQICKLEMSQKVVSWLWSENIFWQFWFPRYHSSSLYMNKKNTQREKCRTWDLQTLSL